MTDILLPGVALVLGAAQGDADTIAGAAEPLPPAVAAAATAAAGVTGAVAAALDAFARRQADGLTAAQARIDGLLFGASTATQAYVDADHEMAVTHQQAAGVLGLGRFGPR